MKDQTRKHSFLAKVYHGGRFSRAYRAREAATRRLSVGCGSMSGAPAPVSALEELTSGYPK